MDIHGIRNLAWTRAHNASFNNKRFSHGTRVSFTTLGCSVS